MGLRMLELTPPGRGGVSVLALVGEGAIESAQRLFSRSRLLPGALAFARLELAGGDVDEVLVCVRAADRVELHLHGNPTLIREVRCALNDDPSGASSAPRSQSELAARLLHGAPSASAARILLDQAEGALARELDGLRRMNDDLLAEGLRRLLERSRHARFALEPATVVLAGPVNAGKSTLFNLLVGTRRASVSAEGGTTRDALQERALLGAYPVEIIDTAGERSLCETSGAASVELTAQAIARAWTRRAELVLWLQPPGFPTPPQAISGAPLLAVLPSLADRLPEASRPAGAISCLLDPDGARERVGSCFRETFDLPREPWEPGRGVVVGHAGRRALDRLFAARPDERRAGLAQLLETAEASADAGR